MKSNIPEPKIKGSVSSETILIALGMLDSEDRQAKAMTAIRIEQLMQENKLTQTAVAKQMNLTQPEVSLIVRGRLKGFTLERLLKALMAMDQDVDIVIRPKRDRTGSAHLHVAYGGLD